MPNSTYVNREIAAKVLATVDQGLCKGLGQPVAGEMCIEAAVCFAMGLPHNDNPPCVSQTVRALKIGLNDSNWSSNKARAKGMRRLAIAQLGTNKNFDDKAFIDALVKSTISKVVPRALRATARIHPSLEHKQKLEAAAVECEKNPSYAASYAEDEELATFAEEVVQILISMKAEGTEWLDLTE